MSVLGLDLLELASIVVKGMKEFVIRMRVMRLMRARKGVICVVVSDVVSVGSRG